MKKIALCLLLCMLVAVFAASCTDKANNTDAGTNNAGENEPVNPDTNTEKPDTNTPVENTGDNSEPSEEEDEEYLYYYNPKIATVYRRDDNYVLFSTENDVKVKDPDGNLYKHIYISATEDGEPIAWATSAELYEAEMSSIFGVTFDVTLPETFYLCFAELDGEGNGDADLENVLCDNIGFGIYAKAKLADGKRVAAIKNGDEKIVAVKWTPIAITDPEVVYSAPGGGPIEENVLIENCEYCTVVRDTEGTCEVTFTGSAFRLYMLCNVQDNGNACYNVPALIVYLDGEEYSLISMTDFDKYVWKQKRDLVFEDTTIPYGEHTIKFVNTTEGAFNSIHAYYCGFEYCSDKNN